MTSNRSYLAILQKAAGFSAVAAGGLLSALAAAPAQAQSITMGALFHDQGPLFDSAVEPSATTPVTLKLQAATGNLTSASLIYFDSSNSQYYTIAMTKAGKDPTGKYDYWTGTVPASASEKYYYFQVNNGSATAYYTGVGASTSQSYYDNFYIIPSYTTPGWMKNGVMYQIFPDRFYDGDTSNDVQTGQYTYEGNMTLHEPFGASPYAPSGYNNAYVFFGGDLLGIQDKLSYVTSTLGANILYLNPVFDAPSNHKYDTTDYFKVDPAFGGNSALQSLITAVHSASGHVVLDGVFNHTGDSNSWFGEASYDGSAMTGTPGAYQSQSSPTYSWYTFYTWPNSYAEFPGASTLPKLDYGSTGSAVRNEIYGSPTSVAQTYLKAPWSIDGWRLDASQYLDSGGNQGSDDTNHQIWREFRTAVKGADSNADIFGENFGDTSPWLYNGDEMDGMTNVEGFTTPVSEWITGEDIGGNANSLSVTDFDSALRSVRALIPTNSQQVMANYLGNHDMERFAQRANGNIYETYLALFFLMTYVGTPTIYYGDEYGMLGQTDPDSRRTFDWTKATTSNAAVALTQKLIAIRKKYSALRTGSFMTLLTDDANNIYAYARLDTENRIVVVLNNTNNTESETIPVAAAGIADGTVLTDAVSGAKFTVASGSAKVSLMGHYGLILVPNTAASATAEPTITPAGGTYATAQSVTITAAKGATLYYTTDGSTPTTKSSVYTKALAASSTEEIQAIAVASGLASSSVASAAFTITGDAPRFDFNADGRADLVWYNSGSGQVSVWDMNDQKVLSYGAAFAQLAPSSGWVPVATPDVNDDGYPDLLWWNKNTGELSLWTLNGDKVAKVYGDFATLADTTWKPVAAADVTGATWELIFQNTATGDLSAWQMNRRTVTSYGPTFASLGANSLYQVVGAPDIDGDGKSDLLFWDSATGGVSYWSCNLASSQVLSYHGDFTSLGDTSWHLVGSEDTNGDGHPDLLWWNATTGEVSRWLLNGTAVTNYGADTATVADTTWQPTAIR